ncbi:hypothetical protein [Caballeronia sp. Sq4a]|uniref:hypothetical protein n=1 Tax=Caballeronia sp. Sq4a TaxID=2878152 RepID=UPI0020BD5D4B|nr:hypothetical protein [Caballeronia sp. Sq4a]
MRLTNSTALSTLLRDTRLSGLDAALVALSDACDAAALGRRKEHVRSVRGLPDAAFVAALFDGGAF